MYEDIKKPALLKFIPMQLVRPLPSIYYYGKYENANDNSKPKKFLDSNINFLDEALVFLSNRLDILQFKDISRQMYRLKKTDPEQYLRIFISAVEKLSCVCECNLDKIKKFIQTEKNKLNEMYLNNILRLSVLIINIDQEEKLQKKITSTLKNNCNYDVNLTDYNHPNISSFVLESDVVIFNSTFNSIIHNLTDNIKSYKKPAIALVPMEGNEEKDRIAFRHGNQLKKRDVPVVYKTFTPIRMFTCIDREFIKFNLN